MSADRLKVGLLGGHLPPVRLGDRDCRRRIARTSMGSRKIWLTANDWISNSLDRTTRGERSKAKASSIAGRAPLRAKRLLSASVSGGLLEAVVSVAMWVSINDRAQRASLGCLNACLRPQSGKENLLAKTAPSLTETLDCDSWKCDSRIRQNTRRASEAVTFRGPFSFAYLLLCLSLDVEAIVVFVAMVSPSRRVLRLEFRH
jgi:hypothetical protein